MTLAQLINSVPAASSTDSMAEWFAEVQYYATENENFDLYVSASEGLFFIGNTGLVVDCRSVVLAMLKALQTG